MSLTAKVASVKEVDGGRKCWFTVIRHGSIPIGHCGHLVRDRRVSSWRTHAVYYRNRILRVNDTYEVRIIRLCGG
jgi:hypothetical protein